MGWRLLMTQKWCFLLPEAHGTYIGYVPSIRIINNCWGIPAGPFIIFITIIQFPGYDVCAYISTWYIYLIDCLFLLITLSIIFLVFSHSFIYMSSHYKSDSHQLLVPPNSPYVMLLLIHCYSWPVFMFQGTVLNCYTLELVT